MCLSCSSFSRPPFFLPVPAMRPVSPWVSRRRMLALVEICRVSIALGNKEENMRSLEVLVPGGSAIVSSTVCPCMSWSRIVCGISQVSYVVGFCCPLKLQAAWLFQSDAVIVLPFSVSITALSPRYPKTSKIKVEMALVNENNNVSASSVNTHSPVRIGVAEDRSRVSRTCDTQKGLICQQAQRSK